MDNKGVDEVKRIFLWSCPRNISTALMYSFAQRSDTAVVDEPLYGHYLHQTSAKTYHPGADEILNSMETDGRKVLQSMLEREDKPVIFYKNMTHHLEGLPLEFLDKGYNLLLTRDPKEMITSFTKIIPNPSLKDTGYEDQVYLYRHCRRLGIPVKVVDTQEILLNPEKRLREICDFLKIPFEKAMLSWKPGSIPEDGVWAKYWYKNVHQSRGFQPYKAKKEEVPSGLSDLFAICERHYKELTS
ncbi:sulfotransferase-like domain-containing protein [Pleomorphovibrio marinus]|uniref:sulfotransferase-like domain-containing protein n=1 Tax=Pleomorphovibrio marinus TaxID=2164132 RepID=UPI0018E5901B|nr:sulfotransferase family protein [Pleomorphovibrio marinus]